MPVEGVEQCTANLANVSVRCWEDVVKAFGEECFLIMGDAMDICPVKSGVMRSTIPTTSSLSHTADSAMFTIGAATNYALYVHENLMAYHIPPTRAKFIEIPINNRAPSIADNIRVRLGGKRYEVPSTEGRQIL